MAWTCFTNQHEQGPSKAFGSNWWFWLVTTGFGLGATVSVKWVGLFTIAWIGSLTIVQLWVLLGDSRQVTMVSTSFLISAALRYYMGLRSLSASGLNTFWLVFSVSSSFPSPFTWLYLLFISSALLIQGREMASCLRSFRLP